MSTTEDEEPATYRIKRHYRPGVDKKNEVVREGLTLEEAQDHCSDQPEIISAGYARIHACGDRSSGSQDP